MKGHLENDESAVFEKEDAFKFQLGDAEVKITCVFSTSSSLKLLRNSRQTTKFF